MNLSTSKSSSSKTLENKIDSLQFLPQILDIISNSKNFEYKGKKLKSSYVIDIVHNLILKYYFKRENNFNLSSVILKHKYGHLYNYYINYLVDNKILIMVMNYKKGTRSRIYSLSETVLRGKINRYRNKDKVLIKKYKTNVIDTSSSSNLIESEIKTKLISDLFSVKIEIERSIFYLDSLKNESLDIYNRNKYSVESIHENSIFYHFDSYGRLHTNFTILKSFIRKNCLLIDGYETCEKDIHNSQPLFLAKLIHDTGTKWVNPDELKLFGNLTLSGNYYKYLMNSFGIKDKSHVKEMTYKVLFGRNGVTSKVDIMFSKLFPTIHNFIKLYKKEMGDYRVLAHELQREESNLIFNKIIKSIVSVNPDIKIITVHDSIIFPVIYRDLVDPIFDRMVNEEFSFLR